MGASGRADTSPCDEMLDELEVAKLAFADCCAARGEIKSGAQTPDAIVSPNVSMHCREIRRMTRRVNRPAGKLHTHFIVASPLARCRVLRGVI
jgi:hypothetical protein